VLDATSWVRVGRVARLFPELLAAPMPCYVVTRAGGREATVAACAAALGVPSHTVRQALQAEELGRLAGVGTHHAAVAKA
jgi:hypothetical protein